MVSSRTFKPEILDRTTHINKKHPETLRRISEHNHSSPFLKLPPEIKSMIYDHVIAEEIVLVVNPRLSAGPNRADFILPKGTWFSLPWSVQECWELFVSRTRAHEALQDRDRFLNLFQPSPLLTRGYLRTCQQMMEESEPKLFQNSILEFTQIRSMRAFISASSTLKWPILSCIKYLGLSAEVGDRDRESIRALADMVTSIPENFPTLRRVIIEYTWVGYTLKQIQDCLPFKTPAEIELGMNTNTRKRSHDRFLQAVVKLMELPLDSADISFGGHEWSSHEFFTWYDYVKAKLRRGQKIDIEDQRSSFSPEPFSAERESVIESAPAKDTTPSPTPSPESNLALDYAITNPPIPRATPHL